MREILGKAKTVRELLSGVQYSVDYYQREYNWKEKQIRELLEDLSGKFLEEHQADHERHRVAEYPLHRLLARLTDYIEVQSGNPSRYHEYVSEHGRNRYEVEHIWADKPERHTDEFPHPTDFSEYRNRIGGLLLLPKSFNASYGALTYEEKLPHYNTQNLLARSLHEQCYDHNPGFLKFVEKSGLHFTPHAAFRKAEFDRRGELYREIAKQIWEPDELLKEDGP